MSGDPVRIRPAVERDLPLLSELLDLLFELEQDFEPCAVRQIRGLKMMLDSPERTLLVAECSGRIAGFCGIQLLVSTAMGGWSAHVEDLVLFPEFRRRGVGEKLLGAAARWARSKGAVRLDLNCDDSNLPARNFYEKLGWTRTHLFNYFKFKFED